MGYPKGVLTIGINVCGFTLGQGTSLSRASNSACWAEVAKGKGVVAMTSKGVAIAYPAQYLPFSSFK